MQQQKLMFMKWVQEEFLVQSEFAENRAGLNLKLQARKLSHFCTTKNSGKKNDCRCTSLYLNEGESIKINHSRNYDTEENDFKLG